MLQHLVKTTVPRCFRKWISIFKSEILYLLPVLKNFRQGREGGEYWDRILTSNQLTHSIVHDSLHNRKWRREWGRGQLHTHTILCENQFSIIYNLKDQWKCVSDSITINYVCMWPSIFQYYARPADVDLNSSQHCGLICLTKELFHHADTVTGSILNSSVFCSHRHPTKTDHTQVSVYSLLLWKQSSCSFFLQISHLFTLKT